MDLWFPICLMGYLCCYRLFILMLRLSQIHPAGSSSIWLLCPFAMFPAPFEYFLASGARPIS